MKREIKWYIQIQMRIKVPKSFILLILVALRFLVVIDIEEAGCAWKRSQLYIYNQSWKKTHMNMISNQNYQKDCSCTVNQALAVHRLGNEWRGCGNKRFHWRNESAPSLITDRQQWSGLGHHPIARRRNRHPYQESQSSRCTLST